jgi:hypothetical protein
MIVQVFYYANVGDRDKNIKKGGTVVGEAKTPGEFVTLVTRAPRRPLNYFVEDVSIEGYEAVLRLLRGDESIERYKAARELP